MKKNYPQKMMCVCQKKSGDTLVIDEVFVPELREGEVLVKIHCSPVNPSDLSFLQGTYAVKPDYPLIPGIEACGTVVAAGKGLLPKLRLGKRVACTSNNRGGAWAEYMVTSATKCVPLINDISDEQASMLLVNPLTALAFIDIAKSSKHQAIIQTAATGALGKMLIHLCRREGIDLINIVRSTKGITDLEKIGAKDIICSEDHSFLEKLRKIASNKMATMALDCIGGNITQYIAEAMPMKSTIYAYAKLSEKDTTIDARTLIQKEISLVGFYLSHWLEKQFVLKKIALLKKAQQFMKETNPVLIQRKVDLYTLQSGIEDYKKNMSIGKIILSMQK